MSVQQSPRFFTFSGNQVKEVSEPEYIDWINKNWHPGQLLHAATETGEFEIWLGFQGHYKFCEWKGKPFNVTVLIYGQGLNDQVIDEYYESYAEAYERFCVLAGNRGNDVMSIAA